MALTDHLTESARRSAVVDDAEQVLKAEVRDKSGLTGIAVKATFKVVEGFSPNFVHKAIDDLLDDFIGQIEPFYDQWVAEGGSSSCPDFFTRNGSAVADALLSITDGRAQKSRHRALVKAYGKLRPKGKQHVQAAMPRVGALIERQTRDLRS